MIDFDVGADCPECRFPVWIRRSEVAAQVTVLCPCCRTQIRLVNPAGSAATVERQIRREVEKVEEEFSRMLKGLFG